VFGSKVFLKYFSNTIVSQNIIVSNNLMCLAYLSKRVIFEVLEKQIQTSFPETEVLLAQAV
jgi:hypothetical protein